MKINETILKVIKSNNNMITTAQAVELGFTRSLLSWYVKEGLLERGSEGFIFCLILFAMTCIH